PWVDHTPQTADRGERSESGPTVPLAPRHSRADGADRRYRRPEAPDNVFEGGPPLPRRPLKAPPAKTPQGHVPRLLHKGQRSGPSQRPVPVNGSVANRKPRPRGHRRP